MPKNGRRSPKPPFLKVATSRPRKPSDILSVTCLSATATMCYHTSARPLFTIRSIIFVGGKLRLGSMHSPRLLLPSLSSTGTNLPEHGRIQRYADTWLYSRMPSLWLSRNGNGSPRALSTRSVNRKNHGAESVFSPRTNGNGYL